MQERKIIHTGRETNQIGNWEDRTTVIWTDRQTNVPVYKCKNRKLFTQTDETNQKLERKRMTCQQIGS